MPADRSLAAFYRSLGQLLQAGVVMDAALEGCAAILPEARAAARIVAQGRPLSAALGRFPRAFPLDHVRLLQAAERAGSVDTILLDLADYADEMTAAWRTVKSGLALPVFTVHVAAFIAPVPALVLGQSGFGGYVVAALEPLAVLWGVVGLLVVVVHRAPVRILDAVLQLLPVVRDAWRELQRWRMAATLRLLMRTSLDLPTSLRFAASVCADQRIAAVLRQAAADTEHRGTPVSAALAASGAWPADVVALWRTAEVTGSLDTMFARLATRYAESFQARVKEIAVWFPRVVYLLVAFGMALQVFRLAGSYLGHLDAMR